MDKQVNKAIQEQLSTLKTHLEALDKQVGAFVQQAQQQTEALAAAGKINQQLTDGAMASASLTSRWNRPYGFAHYLVTQNEERAKEAQASIDALREAVEALLLSTFYEKPTAQEGQAGQDLASRVARLVSCAMDAVQLPKTPATSGVAAGLAKAQDAPTFAANPPLALVSALHLQTKALLTQSETLHLALRTVHSAPLSASLAS